MVPSNFMSMRVIAQSQITRGFVSLVLLAPLFIGTLSPHPPVTFANGTDVYAHWGGFFLISGALLSLHYAKRISALVFLLVLAVSLEAAQAFVDGRHVSAGDAIANLLGALCAFVVFRALSGMWISRYS